MHRLPESIPTCSPTGTSNGRAAELNVKNLTVAQKKAIDVKYEQDSLSLSLDFNRRRLQAALQAEADLTSARLAQQQEGSIEALQAQTDQLAAGTG